LGYEQHTVAVLAPTLHLTVTIEAATATDDIHIHPGGQGFWIARMLTHLREQPLLCGPVGGEAGEVMRALMAHFEMSLSVVDVADNTSIAVHDRRSGERSRVATSPAVKLARHEVDDLYGSFLDKSMACSLCVVTGTDDDILEPTFYKRLGNDLAAGEVTVVADLHGAELHAFLEGGAIDILKVSDEDLVGDGLLEGHDDSDGRATGAMARLIDAGAKAVVLSRQHKPALARFGDTTYVASTPKLEPADHRGAGDSMTAGLAASVSQGLDHAETLALASAAGAANVTRHGLGSADNGLIEELMTRVEVSRVEPMPA
jgi:1-phosphofructokinase